MIKVATSWLHEDTVDTFFINEGTVATLWMFEDTNDIFLMTKGASFVYPRIR